jgi:hypothetical protein
LRGKRGKEGSLKGLLTRDQGKTVESEELAVEGTFVSEGEL